jgi:hypothetical protein
MKFTKLSLAILLMLSELDINSTIEFSIHGHTDSRQMATFSTVATPKRTKELPPNRQDRRLHK